MTGTELEKEEIRGVSESRFVYNFMTRPKILKNYVGS